MTAILHPVAGKKKSAMLCEALAEGGAQGHIFYGVDASNHDDWVRVRGLGEPYLYIDNSYFDKTRDIYYRVTLNAVQETRWLDSDCSRFDRCWLPIMEAKPRPKGYTLRILQSPVFMQYTMDGTLTPFGSRHQNIKTRPWSHNKPEQIKTFPRDLDRTALLVTHSSSAAVAAVLAGVPVETSKVSAAHWFSGKPITHPIWEERRRWAGSLADRQFTIEEMRNGYAWRVLNG